ncbi:MAG TPA: hypothetical protein DDY32_03430 [Desulfobulbaceae bacterium]|nr:hypothetical protein [Desulfobulbaceae bacterium]
MTKRILVDGDVIVDHHIFQGLRPFPNSTEKLGSQISTCMGGASLLFELCRGLCQDEHNIDTQAPFGLLNKNYREIENIPSHRRAYAVWSPCKKNAKSKDDDPKVWRVTQMFGYGSKVEGVEKNPENATTVSDAAEVVVLDDAALDYRFDRTAWPACLNRIDVDGTRPEWIVMKMSHPLCQGDLWYELRKFSNDKKFMENFILIVSASDLRRSEVMISQGRSWEQTVEDLLAELQINPELTELHKCQHLIVHFESEGALWIDSTENSSRHLVFDSGNLEGKWGNDMPGQVLGRSSCFAAGVVSALLEHLNVKDQDHTPESQKLDLTRGISNGLAAMRMLKEIGFGVVDSKAAPGFPVSEIVKKIKNNEESGFSTVSIAKLSPDDKKPWTLIDGNLFDIKLPLFGFARQVARYGPKVLNGIPYGKFGSLFTVDRRELESLNGIRQLIDDYVKLDDGKKPLSIGVFGPPGAGKSFGIQEIAKGILGEKTPFLTFNLSQFRGQEMLIGALHQVRDEALKGKPPVVFWDEFDCGGLEWLQYLLAPMQDGAFLEGQITHPIGKCIFVFAGGTRYTMQSFSPDKSSAKYDDFKLKKGPDFVSRLRGYLDVLGPNPRQLFDPKTNGYDLDATDTCFPIRRALLLRVMSKVYGDKAVLRIDSGLLNAFLKIKEYKHGARSLETIVKLTIGKKGGLMRSNLPPREQMALHVDYDCFMRLIQQDMQFKTACKTITPTLAQSIHQFYLDLAKKNGWKVKYDMLFNDPQLPAEIKDDNVAAAVRIPEVLSLVGLQVALREEGATKDEGKNLAKIKAHIEHHLEILAEAEHNGWMGHKVRNGWRYGEQRDDRNKIHNCLKKYNVLDLEDKEKDRDAVRNYPEIISKAGYTIVFESESC